MSGNIGMDRDGFPGSVPRRFRPYFRALRWRFENGVGFKWECRLCGKVIRQNNAGAQSHVATHLRARETDGAKR